MKQQKAAVISNRELYPGVYLLWVQANVALLKTRPGQFFMVKCGEETTLRRPISIHLIDEAGQKIAFLYAVVGKGTDWLAKLPAGDIVDILGPLGNGFTLDKKTKNILLVAGGIGMAPLAQLAQTAHDAGKKVTLLLGAATASKLYPSKLLPPGVKVVLATDDGTKGHQGLVTDLLPRYAPPADRIYICGPMPMFKYIAAQREKLGLAGKQVNISLEMRMACGIGVCLGCTIRTVSGPKEVCHDGPVFRLDEVIWDELTEI